MTEQSLPLCKFRTFKKVNIKTARFTIKEEERAVYCKILDHWVSPAICENCIRPYLGGADQ